jgi:peptidoglycan/LPS O-acetylase OafA/YrhL
MRPFRPAHSKSSSAPLEDAFDPRRNSLSLLRLVFAAMVLLDHAFPLGGFHGSADPMWGWTEGQESLGGLAVFGFFVVSGFLVTRSFDGSPNFVSYIWKRFLRIFPGFWVCLLVTVLVFAPLAFWFEHSSLQGYLHTHTDSPSGYLKNNALLSMNQYNIDDLLANNPYAHVHAGFQAWDGSLWTLIYEFKCYLGVMVLGMIGVFRKWRPTVIVLALGLWALQLKQFLHPGYLQGTFLLGDPNMVRLAFIFSLGMLFYLYRDKIIISNTLAAVALVVFIAGMRLDLYYGVGAVMWAYLCMWAAVRLPFHNVDKYGDFSYGLYIYAFPVEQMLSLYHVNSWGYVPYVLLSLAVATVLAVGSWYGIERPSQRLKRLNFRRPRGADPSNDPVVGQVNRSHQSAALHTVDDLESSVSRADGMQNGTPLGASLGNAGPPGPSTSGNG